MPLNKGCHRIYFAFLAVTIAGKCYSIISVITFTVKVLSFSETVIMVLLLISADEIRSDEASLLGVDNEIASEEESFSSQNQKYKQVFHKSDEDNQYHQYQFCK
jgi:hypothetical protein